MNHDIGQCPHLCIERDDVHWLLLERATKELRHWLQRVQSVIILYGDWLRWWTNFEELLNGIPCDNEFLLLYPIVDVVSFHSGISEELPYEFSTYISTWI